MSRSARSFMSSTRRHSTRRESRPKRVAVMQVVVDHRGQQVVRARHGVDVAGEVQVDVVGRHHLRAAAARAAALHAEIGAERRLAQRRRRLDPVQRQALRRVRSEHVVLPSPAGVGVIAETRIETSARIASVQRPRCNLGLVVTVRFEVRRVEIQGARDFGDGLHGGALYLTR